MVIKPRVRVVVIPARGKQRASLQDLASVKACSGAVRVKRGTAGKENPEREKGKIDRSRNGNRRKSKGSLVCHGDVSCSHHYQSSSTVMVGFNHAVPAKTGSSTFTTSKTRTL